MQFGFLQSTLVDPMLRAISSLLLALTIGSCGESTEGPFESDDGVRLTCPAGWSITEDKPNEIGGYYLQLEKDSFNSSGMIVINWAGEVFDRAVFLDGAVESIVSFQDKLVFNDIELGPSYEATFGPYPALKKDYTFGALHIKHRCSIYALNAAGKTFLIMKQEAKEDHLDSRPGFEVIESSFHCAE